MGWGQTSCPHCQGTRLHGKGPYVRSVRHLDSFRGATRLVVHTRRFPCPRYLGIEEHTLHKSRRFCTTFCDLKNRRIFDVRPGRSEADLAAFLGKLKGRDKVKIVCIDVASPYRSLIRRYFPKARIVADRFHVVRLIQHRFMRLARHPAANLKSHRGNLAALRKAPERLTGKQRPRLQKLFTAHPILQVLHAEMHQLRDLMNHKHRTKAGCRELIPRLLEKIRHLRERKAGPLQTLAATLQYWRTDRLHVAHDPQRRHHRRLPPQDNAHPTPRLWLQELRELPAAGHRPMRLNPHSNPNFNSSRQPQNTPPPIFGVDPWSALLRGNPLGEKMVGRAGFEPAKS